MKKLSQEGSVNVWLIAFAGVFIMLIGSLGFGYSMFASREDYKNNVDQKIDEAVLVAEAATGEKKETEFIEREKNPLRTYTSPASYGSVGVDYPKTWSAYIDESGKGTNPVDGYMNPAFVPNIQEKDNHIALRFQVVNSSYAQSIRTFESLVKAGKIRTTPFVADKVQGTTGIRADGEILSGKVGSMVVLPLRDKTLKVWTESAEFMNDFNSIILPGLTFSP